eukprot:641715-Prorocentrum_minimum.AAC.1
MVECYVKAKRLQGAFLTMATITRVYPDSDLVRPPCIPPRILYMPSYMRCRRLRLLPAIPAEA